MKKILAGLILTVIIVSGIAFVALPSVANAQAKLDKPAFNGLVPCGKNSGTAEEMAPCTLCHFIVGFQRLTKYAFYLVTTLAFAGIFISGAMYIISVGDEHLMQQAKSFITASLIGFAVVLGAWLIVNVTMWVIATKGDLGVGKVEWNKFTCSTASSVNNSNTPSVSNQQGGGLGGSGGGLVIGANCCVIGLGQCNHVKDASQCTTGRYQEGDCSGVNACKLNAVVNAGCWESASKAAASLAGGGFVCTTIGSTTTPDGKNCPTGKTFYTCKKQ